MKREIVVVIIEDRHDYLNITVHPSQDDANASIHEYVKEYWSQEWWTKARPMPKDPEDAISQYFELGWGQEFLTVETVEIDTNWFREKNESEDC